MIIELPYHTSLLAVAGSIIVSVVYIIAKAVVELDKRRK